MRIFVIIGLLCGVLCFGGCISFGMALRAHVVAPFRWLVPTIGQQALVLQYRSDYNYSGCAPHPLGCKSFDIDHHTLSLNYVSSLRTYPLLTMRLPDR
jgi:hypothetical protein